MTTVDSINERQVEYWRQEYEALHQKYSHLYAVLREILVRLEENSQDCETVLRILEREFPIQ